MSTTCKLTHRTMILAVLVTLSVVCSGALAASADNATALERVRSTNESLHAKAIALEKLAIAGGAESVASLANLLDSPSLAHYARYALQTNPDPTAGEALRNALDHLEGPHLIGVINSLASRGDQQAVDTLARLIRTEDPRVAVAAAGALATIGSESALAALEQSPLQRTLVLADPLLQAALAREGAGEPDKAEALLNRIIDANPPAHVKQAANLSLLKMVGPEEASVLLTQFLASPTEWEFVVGLQASVQANPTNYAKELSESLLSSPPDRQARLLSALESKTENVSLEAIRAASKSQHANVRIAAASALGALGNGSDGPLLVRLALDDPESNQAATEALIRIKDPRLNEYLIGMLGYQEPSQQALAAGVLGLRHAVTASGELFEMANRSNSAEVRLAAIGALRRVAPGSTLGQILDLYKDTQGSDEKLLARQASAEVASRSADTESATATVAERLKSWPSDKHAVLLDVLAKLGGRDSLRVVAEAAESPDRETQNQATRVLGAWPTADAAPTLLRLASSEHPYAVRSLRGYLRIARQYNAGEERLAMCRHALEVASRDEECLLALKVLALSPSIESLSLAASQLSSDALGSKASEAVLAIAEAVAPTNPREAADAARAVISAGGSEEIVARAKKL